MRLRESQDVRCTADCTLVPLAVFSHRIVAASDDRENGIVAASDDREDGIVAASDDREDGIVAQDDRHPCRVVTKCSRTREDASLHVVVGIDPRPYTVG